MHDQRADRPAFAPQRYAHQRPCAGGARWLESRPIRYLRINVLDVGQMDWPILAINRTRHVMAADLELLGGNRCRNALRTFPDIDAVAPLVARPGDANGHS